MQRFVPASIKNSVAALACLLSVAGALHAQVNVTPTVVVNAGLFSYSYTVQNLGTMDLAIVTFPATPATPATVMSLTAPTGFGATYDSGLGLVSFFEDNDPATPQTFAAGSTSAPFSFTSRIQPSVVQFEALDIGGSTFNGSTVAPVPEPSTILVGLALSAFCLGSGRRQSRQAAV